ncbi:MED6-domain-containing protein [Boletus reticuloceps]|uniref:Mediator of RNA polymerase II transcription subunit 6 n=1 Tax=Boletus reticuloceps TaxID=495285 RepID=A0A8I3AGE6_9AGAM|nr:MED6-domain-containing protein [Boletus reticuloceps]
MKGGVKLGGTFPINHSHSMDDKDLHPSDDYSHRFFIWHEWIQAHGPLSTENVFDYFATSMFYDKQSNNQVLRMQTIHTGTPILNEAEELKYPLLLPRSSPTHPSPDASPVSSSPLPMHRPPPSSSYTSASVSPQIKVRPFLVPRSLSPSPPKSGRSPPTSSSTTASISLPTFTPSSQTDWYFPPSFPYPLLIPLVQLTSLNALQSSLDLLRRHRPDYTPRSGFVWPIIDSSLSDTQPKKPDLDVPHIDDSAIEATDKQQPHGPKKHQNNSLMVYAMRTTAMHSNIASSRSQPSDHSASTSAHPSASSQPPLTSTPLAQRPATPKAPSAVPSPQDPPPVKGPVGAGKKKKKRMSLVSRMSIPLTHIQALQSW